MGKIGQKPQNPQEALVQAQRRKTLGAKGAAFEKTASDVIRGAELDKAQPEPMPAIEPLPTFENPDQTTTDAQKLKRLRGLRAGMLSTIKTSAQGTQAPPLVSTPGLYSSGTKGKLGQ